MGKEETFFELYDLLEDRLNQRGHIQAKEAWDICKNYTKKSYNTFYVVFTSIMETMIEQKKAEIVIGERGVYNILKPNRG